MFDVSQIAKRYFDIRLTVEPDEGEAKTLELQLEPPKIKQLNKLTSVASAGLEACVGELRDGVRSILSKNKSGYAVPEEYIDNLDYDQMTGILTAYLDWVVRERQAKN